VRLFKRNKKITFVIAGPQYNMSSDRLYLEDALQKRMPNRHVVVLPPGSTVIETDHV
jgi:hypothetical protein